MRAPAIIAGAALPQKVRPMTPDYFDDDENVKAMRETAHAIGLTQLLIDARDGIRDAAEAVTLALRLLGISSEERS